MQEMLFRSTFRWRLRPRSVARDAALRHQGEHSGHIEKAGIRAYSALADQGKRTSLLTIEGFVYDAQRDVYTSPRRDLAPSEPRPQGGYAGEGT